MRTSLGLVGDLDDVDLIEDVEQAFGVRLPDDELGRCETVGDLFELIIARLPDEPKTADRCATAMCLYRVRRAILTVAPLLDLRPSSPIGALRDVSVRALYRAIAREGGLRPPFTYMSGWGCACLLAAVAVPAALFWWGAPWWTAAISLIVAMIPYRLSPLRLPPKLTVFGDLIELIAARNVGTLAALGARLRPTEAWKALQTVCADHAVLDCGEIERDTLIIGPARATM